MIRTGVVLPDFSDRCDNCDGTGVVCSSCDGADCDCDDRTDVECLVCLGSGNNQNEDDEEED